MLSETPPIYYTQELRSRWPKPLAREWYECYPLCFDASDLKQAEHQPQHHFHEWLGAVYLFHQDGMFALVEKYYSEKSHPDKFNILRKVLGKDRVACLLEGICENLGIQPPDLFVYSPDFMRCRFVEMKGPDDAPTPEQEESHKWIVRELKVPVEIINAEILPMGQTRTPCITVAGVRLNGL